jgi:hypothetical protein
MGEGTDGAEEGGVGAVESGRTMIPPTYKPKKKFMQLAIAEAKRARDRGDMPSVPSSRSSLEIGKWLSHLPATG